MAGVVGAGVAAAAAASPASAATGQAVNQGELNDVGTDQPATEIKVANSTATPTVILTNTGTTGTDPYGDGEASPPLRITPAAAALTVPPTSTVGGDVVATGDGNLWFTHAFPGTSTPVIVPATVHTDATSNSFAPLVAPQRILDTRSSSGRSHVLDPSGKFDSTGRLLAGKTIHINLSGLVTYGTAVTANLTVTKSASGGYLILWPGGTRPTTSSINYSRGQTIANLATSGIDTYSSTVTDSIAIYAYSTTHVILDVAGFFVSSFAQINPAYLAPALSPARMARAAKRTFTQP